MNDFLEDTLKKPSNQKLGKFLGIHESTVRKRMKETPEIFKQNLRDYRMSEVPFISLEDYNLEKGTNYTVEEIEQGKIPAIKSKDEYLIPTIWDDFKMSMNELRMFPDSNVISMSNFKGGVGKTSTAINVATSMSFLGLDVLIVDFDVQGNTTSMFDLYRHKRNNFVDLSITKIDELYDVENSDYKYTVFDLIAEVENDDIEEMVKSSTVNLGDKINTNGRFDILPSSSNIENALKFEEVQTTLSRYGNVNKALDEVLSYIKEDYDVVIIDTPPSISLPLRMGILATDYFVIALTADKMAKDGIEPFLIPIQMNSKAYKKEKGKDITILGGILNKYQKNSRIQRTNKDIINNDLLATIENSRLGSADLFEQVIKLDNILTEAQYEFGSALVCNPNSTLTRDYFNISIEIIDRILIDKIQKA